jgi:hypothetical protein
MGLHLDQDNRAA